MSKLEDDISRVMAGHNDEAPAAADLLRSLEQAPQPRRPGWYMPLVAAAAVVAVVAGSASVGGLLGGHRQAPATVLGGPARSHGCLARRATPIRPRGCLPNRLASTAARAWSCRGRPVRR